MHCLRYRGAQGLGAAALIAAAAGCGAASSAAGGPDASADASAGDVSTGDAEVPPEAPPPPPLEGGACTPGDVSMFTPMWHPPVGPYAGACMPMQLDSLVADCLSTNATQASCTNWTQANQGCFACVVTPLSAQKWGPILYTQSPATGGEADYANLAGCVALADPMLTNCAQALEAAFTCEVAACIANCPIPRDPASPDRKAALDALQTCIDPEAADGVCSVFSKQVAAPSCWPETADGGLPPQDGGSGDWCLYLADDMTGMYLRKYVELACGYASPVDAGGPGG